MKQYMFGFQGNKLLGLNHVLLELKKYILYNFEENVGVVHLFERFKRRIMHLIIKEKMLAQGIMKHLGLNVKTSQKFMTFMVSTVRLLSK